MLVCEAGLRHAHLGGAQVESTTPRDDAKNNRLAEKARGVRVTWVCCKSSAPGGFGYFFAARSCGRGGFGGVCGGVSLWKRLSHAKPIDDPPQGRSELMDLSANEGGIFF